MLLPVDGAEKPSAALVWGIATAMVTVVSCCSLIGVSIMPLISGRSYKIFITLFTGLAVGSLLGSAIFSLIPQAFSLDKLGNSNHLWKSLIIFLGIYLFYCSERLMRIYFDRKTRLQEQQLQLKRNKSNSSLTTDRNGANRAAGDEIANSNKNPATGENNAEVMTEVSLSKEEPDQIVPIHGHHHHGHSHGVATQEILTKALKSSSSVQGALANRPAQIAPVAWMIIIGDGLHNFIDGLSIGAAFSNSIGLGISTSVAVIFEEFPHELGDFAVLISSGMTVRQALGFNFLSACTCYIGMIFGIVLGDTTESATYIFALAGGMFLYISLVDMMGELSAMLEEAKHSTKEATRLLIMQNLGILSGIIIIFTLSLFFSA